MNKVLALGAHSDDLEFGCWGTLEKHRQSGDEVSTYIFGYTKRDMFDQKFDILPLKDFITTIEDWVSVIKPNMVYTHSSGDINRDHRIIHEATMIACRPIPDCSVKEIYAYEVPNFSTEFKPNVFVDIESTFGLKLKALEQYKQELRHYPHPSSIIAMMWHVRNRGNSVGLSKAEAFELVRIIR